MSRKHKVVFFGGIFPNEIMTDIRMNSIGGIQYAADLFQKRLIEGLDSQLESPVVLVNTIFIGAYPARYRKYSVASSAFSHCPGGNSSDYNVGFINLPLIKHVSRRNRVAHLLKHSEILNESEWAFGYSMTFSIVSSLLLAKRLSPKLKTCLIVPDLPQYMNLGKGRGAVFCFIKSLVNKYLYHSLSKIDSFVVLTEAAFAELGVIDKPHVVIEGIAPKTASDESTSYCNISRSITYTGSLDLRYGIDNLLESFSRLPNKDIDLIICGSGDSVDLIHRYANNDFRIKYLGQVSPEKSRLIQASSLLLVNPRLATEDYTKYSFPSKTMEYLASGRPIVMYKLPGIPDEYGDYILFVKDGEGLYDAMARALEMSLTELDRIGAMGKSFLIREKCPAVQAQKVIQMLMNMTC